MAMVRDLRDHDQKDLVGKIIDTEVMVYSLWPVRAYVESSWTERLFSKDS
jgi:uncharacterized protein YbdZ (MbtH family)